MEHPDKVRWRRAEPEELSYAAVAEEEVNVSELKCKRFEKKAKKFYTL